jgi:membrane peptidoglycan carboxypeptidase
MPGEFKSCGRPLKGTKSFHVNNSEGDEGGMMTITQATAESVNAAYMAMESALDLCAVASTAEKIGVHTAVPTDDCGTGRKSTKLPRCIATLTLGVKEVAPVTMAAAYATFANHGVFCEARSIMSVQARGKSLPVPGQNCRQAIPPQIANGVAYVGQFTLKPGGTAAASNLGGRPAAGKTGTTNDDLDTWFCGYTPQLATAVWVGDPTIYADGERRNLKNRRIGKTYYQTIYGFKMAAPIWKEIMLTFHRHLPVAHFQSPPVALIGPPPAPKPPPAKPGDPTKPGQTPPPPPPPGPPTQPTR